MAKFNIQDPGITTTNREGHAAYAMDDKSKLVSQVLSSFFNEAKFYGDNSYEMRVTIQSVIQQDPAFVSNLAVFARREFHMRSVSHVLTAYLAHEPAGKPFTRRTVNGIAVRGDDVTEVMAFYLSTFGKPVPMSLKKGIADVLAGFDEYTLAKYKGSGKSVKMRDLLCLCRPTPKDGAQSAMWKRCIEGTLKTPYTWETELSARGNIKEVWEALIDSGKVGYMALLRNLRNIMQAGPDNIETVWQRIEDPEAVRRSQQFPFRFLSAYRSIPENAGSRARSALENAVAASVVNMPRLSGTTVIAVDVSGSMDQIVSRKSHVSCIETGVLLGLIANRICDNAVFYTFNDGIQQIPLSLTSPILENAVRAEADGGTSMHLPFLKMMEDGVKADRIILLSDNECNTPWESKPVQSLADEYRRKSGNNLWVHAIDLQGYGTQQFHGARTNIITGWSEKVFQFIQIAEAGEGNLKATIENYCFQK